MMYDEIVCGAFLSPEDPDDFKVEGLAGFNEGTEELPEEYLCNIESKPFNQGRRMTCVAVTGANIMEWITKYPMSAEWIYSHRFNKSSEGMYAKDLMKILVKHGDIGRGDWPYGVSERRSYDTEPTKISSYVKVTSIDGLKFALTRYSPCYVALPVRSHKVCFWQEDAKPKFYGYHAVTCIGYDKTGFILRNSWDPDQSTLHLNYEDFKHIAECYSVV